MSIADKIQASIEKSSWIRKMFEEGIQRKADFGEDNVFDFSLGNPNLEPPSELKTILTKLISNNHPGQHAYMPNAGYAETRQAVASYLSDLNAQNFSSDDIVMTVGAGGALNVIFKTILNPGDEVIIPRPYFVEYDFYLDNHQGVPRIVATGPDFALDLKAIETAITESTKSILINTPNNPTGKVYSADELYALGRILEDHSRRIGHPIYLISDEPYRKIVFDGITAPNVFDGYKESFVVTSFSKDLSLPGERIGYAAVNPDIQDKKTIVAGMILSNRILGFVNAPALMQRAICGLLKSSVDISAYQKKRDMLCEGLLSCGYKVTRPGGAFYLFPKTPIEDDVAFVSALQQENILTVPGSGFGGPGHFRIAYCVSDRTIESALPGFERVIRKFI
jgi:aspartate aminotransferase